MVQLGLCFQPRGQQCSQMQLLKRSWQDVNRHFPTSRKTVMGGKGKTVSKTYRQNIHSWAICPQTQRKRLTNEKATNVYIVQNFCKPQKRHAQNTRARDLYFLHFHQSALNATALVLKGCDFLHESENQKTQYSRRKKLPAWLLQGSSAVFRSASDESARGAS